MKRVQRLEYENARLREEIEQLRKTVHKKDKKIERLEFGSHVVTGYITSVSVIQDWYDFNSYGDEDGSHIEFEVKAVKFPLDLYAHLRMNMNRKLKFTIELDNE